MSFFCRMVSPALLLRSSVNSSVASRACMRRRVGYHLISIDALHVSNTAMCRVEAPATHERIHCLRGCTGAFRTEHKHPSSATSLARATEKAMLNSTHHHSSSFGSSTAPCDASPSTASHEIPSRDSARPTRPVDQKECDAGDREHAAYEERRESACS